MSNIGPLGFLLPGNFRYLTGSLESADSHKRRAYLVLFWLMCKVGIFSVVSVKSDMFVQNGSLPECFEVESLATPKIRDATKYAGKEVDHGQCNSDQYNYPTVDPVLSTYQIVQT